MAVDELTSLFTSPQLRAATSAVAKQAVDQAAQKLPQGMTR